MITVKPIGGLGNRLRVIASAYELAQLTGKQLRVIWDANAELNCPFYELFHSSNHYQVLERRSFYLFRVVFRVFISMLSKHKLPLPFVYNKVLYQRQLEVLKKSEFDFKSLKRYNRIYIEAFNNFTPNLDFNKLFIPLPGITKEVNRVTGQMGPNPIGVHIRRTDNIRSIVNSPTEMFIEILQSEVESCSETKIYLATDSPDEEKRIKDAFGDKVLTREKDLSRQSAKGIHDALIDILCLSKTKVIYGSFWSSFSRSASIWGGIELRVVKKD